MSAPTPPTPVLPLAIGFLALVPLPLAGVAFSTTRLERDLELGLAAVFAVLGGVLLFAWLRTRRADSRDDAE